MLQTKNAAGLGALQRFALCDEFATYCRVSQESYWGDGIDTKLFPNQIRQFARELCVGGCRFRVTLFAFLGLIILHHVLQNCCKNKTFLKNIFSLLKGVVQNIIGGVLLTKWNDFRHSCIRNTNFEL